MCEDADEHQADTGKARHADKLSAEWIKNERRSSVSAVARTCSLWVLYARHRRVRLFVAMPSRKYWVHNSKRGARVRARNAGEQDRDDEKSKGRFYVYSNTDVAELQRGS